MRATPRVLVPTLLLSLSLLVTLTATSAWAAGNKKEEAPETTAESLYNEGVDLLEEGSYADAASKFEAALAEREDWAEAHNHLAYSLRQQGADNYAAALEHYNTAIELDPKLAQAYHYRGVLYTLQGDEAQAKADHHKLLELDRELADQLMQVIASGEEPEGMAGAAERWQ